MNANLKSELSDAEWQVRVDLAACYRIVAHFGWDDLIFTHISARVPGPERHFLINPFGLRYDEVTASNLVVVDLEGNAVGTSTPINFAGFVIHSAIHANVPEAHWIMHTHTREGIAVACKASGLTNTNFYSAMVWGHVAYHDFEGVTTRLDECERLVASIGTGCSGAGGPNALTATRLPLIGGSFEALGTGMPPLAFVLAATGLAQTSLPLSTILPPALPGCRRLRPCAGLVAASKPLISGLR